MDLSFTRIVPSNLEPSRLERNISAPSRWPQWFHTLDAVKGPPFQVGSQVTLLIDPNKGSHKKFELVVQVIEHIPNSKLVLRVINDSTGRLTRLFDRLDWIVELEPHGQGTLIKGTASAHTRSWRSRLIGRVAGKILLNQVYYPNIMKLAGLKQPFSTEIPPQKLGLPQSLTQ
jgi:hypothetical protein